MGTKVRIGPFSNERLKVFITQHGRESLVGKEPNSLQIED